MQSSQSIGIVEIVDTGKVYNGSNGVVLTLVIETPRANTSSYIPPPECWEKRFIDHQSLGVCERNGNLACI